MAREPEPVIVTIAHRLGRDGAKQRIEEGLGRIRAEVLRYVKTLDYAWDGYRLNFRVSALLQTITGSIDVFEDSVRIELSLPRLLHLAARTIAGRIERTGVTLLKGPAAR
jgi:hypothetical protein